MLRTQRRLGLHQRLRLVLLVLQEGIAGQRLELTLLQLRRSQLAWLLQHAVHYTCASQDLRARLHILVTCVPFSLLAATS